MTQASEHEMKMKAGGQDLHSSALESPWAAWISENVRKDLEGQTRVALTERLSVVASQHAQQDSELFRQQTEDIIAQLQSDMDGVQEVAAAEEKGRAELKAAIARHAKEEKGLDWEVDDLQERKQRLELMIESDRRRHAAEQAELDRKLAEEAEEGARALHVRADEAARLRDNLHFLQNRHALLPQYVLDNLQKGWDNCSPEWGDEFRKAAEVCKHELRRFTNEADFKVARERLKRNFRAYQEHNATLGSPDAVMLSEGPLHNAGPGEKIHQRADQNTLGAEISEPRRRVLCALLANDVLLSRIHQRQLLQRTYRAPRTREEIDVTWCRGTERPGSGPSNRRGRIAGALAASLSARRGNSTLR